MEIASDLTHKIRSQFPVLNQQVNGKPLIYFDNAATTQKPLAVIDAISSYYKGYNANIHRGIHTLAEKATEEFESTRTALANFVNAKEREEIIFTRGTTESINLVASSLPYSFVGKGDKIIVSGLEHHSNLVPWQMLALKSGADFEYIPVLESGDLDIETFGKIITNKTRIVAINHVSNALGTINPVKAITDMAKSHGALVLIDGAQASSHLDIDVQDIGCDFYAFSAHKMYGPTGIGALWGKRELLEWMTPYQYGGEMIKNVSFEKTTFNELPYKFEAGTPHIEGVIAWKAAIDFVKETGKEFIRSVEEELTLHAIGSWKNMKGIRMYGPKNRVSVVSFTFSDIHSFDIGQMLDASGIAVRTGHHCTEPLMKILGTEGTVRASFAVYNTRDEIDRMTESLEKILTFFRKK